MAVRHRRAYPSLTIFLAFQFVQLAFLPIDVLLSKNCQDTKKLNFKYRNIPANYIYDKSA